ncbi:MAG: DUF5076 domain-containing protein [Chloroflexi bacterium]|nr:DUF5076 domain-containing protein [Chloroflexota bacterium]
MMSGELPIPGVAADDGTAVEIVRVWVAKRAQHVSVATGVWEDPAAWGIMLVDLAKHIAKAYSQTQGHDYASALARIKEGFDVEWDSATDRPTGRVGE